MRFAPLRRSLVKGMLLSPLAVIFLIEDLLVRSFGRAMGAFARLRLVARFEIWARRLPPRQALLLFILPVVIFLPVHLLALWAFASRRVLLGIGIYIAGKLAATAVVGRILIVCRPALMQYRWFERADRWVTRTRGRIHAVIESTALWRGYLSLHAALRAHRTFWGAAFRGRNWWAAARRMAGR
ncbi:MAG: hypothetical protein QOJ54_1151 [Aliidongia sp.]|jgi:hypothetical protein|nr:hypothetical protein [Aliidongia sp.]